MLPRGSAGGALPLVLLLVLAMTALGHAAFLVSLEEEAASRASTASLQARLMTEAGLRRAIGGSHGDTLPDPGGGAALWAEWSAEDAGYRVELRRLSREIYWVEGVGRAALAPGAPERVRDRAARLLWSLSPLERLARVSAVVEYGGELEFAPGAIETTDLLGTELLPAPAGCRDRRSALDTLRRGLLPGAARTLPRVGEPLPGLGFLGQDSLLARVGARAEGAVTPMPVVQEGRCQTDALSNWGSPLNPGGPCGGHRIAIAAEQGLTLEGGEGQGLLLVVGDLHLTGGAYFAGLVVVGGSLTIDGASVLEGLARVRGGVRIVGTARVSGRLCPALLALEAAPGLRRPLHLPGGGWLRPF